MWSFQWNQTWPEIRNGLAQGFCMNVHEQFAEDLALYALGTLQGEERVALERHLEECASCHRELEQLRGDMALLALSTAGPTPPLRARQRLMDAVARESRA